MPNRDGPGYAAAFEPAMRLALAEAAAAAETAQAPAGQTPAERSVGRGAHLEGGSDSRETRFVK